MPTQIILLAIRLQATYTYIARFSEAGNIKTFGAKLCSNPSKFSLSIVSSSIANTGGLRCCPSIFDYISHQILNKVHPSTFCLIKSCTIRGNKVVVIGTTILTNILTNFTYVH